MAKSETSVAQSTVLKFDASKYQMNGPKSAQFGINMPDSQPAYVSRRKASKSPTIRQGQF